MLNVNCREELERPCDEVGQFTLSRCLHHPYQNNVPKKIEDYSNNNRSQLPRPRCMDTRYPDRSCNDRNDSSCQHGASDLLQNDSHNRAPRGTEQPLSDVKGDARGVGRFEGVENVCGEAKEANQVEHETYY